MSKEWRADLRLKLEDLVDKFVVDGAEHKEVIEAIRQEIEHLREAYEYDPDPAEDDTVINEPANDWPAAT
ncbi:flagellar hook-length control protein FliK [Sinorhizobium meliloti]|uniref:flagellar hook-length control protein FliK n=1 Tax=Rhizobium meliloti TaxID=382 RepID=UPI000FE04583|nr:flagellar hook-length control protein FliK [Sinorhizobium meliloti]RVL95617.1 hypothetical protein CN136_19540 [Sinorhizobium meliloti]